MRKAAVLAVGLVVGTIVGAVGWQVGFAVEPQGDTLVVCERPSADLRSPAANGTCPSGYQKTTITETLPDDDPIFSASSPAPVTSQQILDATGNIAIATLTLPPGAYSLVASGTVIDPEVNQGAQTTCDIRIGPTTLDEVHVKAGITGFQRTDFTMSSALEVTGTLPASVKVFCGIVSNDPDHSSSFEWTIVATQGDSLNPLI